MAVSQFLNKFKPKNEQTEHTENSFPSTPSGSASLAEKNNRYDDSKVPYLTWRSLVMGVLASMGGFIFGYSTGMYIRKYGIEMGSSDGSAQVKFLDSRQ
jgi:SP family sugar:H+ symporter-like MFS transporter